MELDHRSGHCLESSNYIYVLAISLRNEGKNYDTELLFIN